MMVDVCRKCAEWLEFVSLVDDGGESVMLACGCMKFNIVGDVVIHDGIRVACVKDSMKRHRRKLEACHVGKAFWKIVGESLGEEHGDMVRKMSKAGVPGGCPYYMEHAISKWNGSVQ